MAAVTSSARPRNAKGSLVYNLGSCFAVLFPQGRHGLDIILDAFAGRQVASYNVVGLLRPRS